MLIRFGDLNYINRLQRWAMRRWQDAANAAQGLAATQAEQVLYSKACNRADRWFATVDRLARLSRLASGD
jgi:hypothetical protein